MDSIKDIVYNYDILGDRAEDFILVQRVLNDSAKEIATMLIADLEIKNINDKPEYDGDKMDYILNSINKVRENTKITEAIFYSELKRKAEEDAKNGQLQGT